MRWISLVLAVMLGIDLLMHRTVDEVSFFQVGQGDATFFSRNGTNLLVDCGPRSLNFDGGQRFVWPELRRRNVKNLDAIILTHFDRDHYGGLQAILERVGIDRVIVVAPEGLDYDNLKILLEIGVRTDQLVVVQSAQQLVVGSLKIDVVPGLTGEKVDDNDQSPFLGVSFGEDRVIITGDASGEVESLWIRQGLSGGRILKAGHHGSNHSLSSEWLAQMDPEFVVFSSGRNNTWGHPSVGALDRAKTSGAETLRTDSMGTVRFMPDSHGRLQLVTREDRPAILQLFQR